MDFTTTHTIKFQSKNIKITRLIESTRWHDDLSWPKPLAMLQQHLRAHLHKINTMLLPALSEEGIIDENGIHQ
jgi:hypothetical protein